MQHQGQRTRVNVMWILQAQGTAVYDKGRAVLPLLSPPHSSISFRKCFSSFCFAPLSPCANRCRHGTRYVLQRADALAALQTGKPCGFDPCRIESTYRCRRGSSMRRSGRQVRSLGRSSADRNQIDCCGNAGSWKRWRRVRNWKVEERQ